MKTEYVDTPRFISDRSVVAVGSFDGIHLGHRAILGQLLERAKILSADSIVVTFDPHPVSVVGNKKIDILTPGDMKVASMATLGIDILVILDFDEEFAKISAEEFVSSYLKQSMGMLEMIAGEDHGFGSNRSVDIASLKAIGEEFDFKVNVVDSVFWRKEPIKSRRIRKEVSRGDMFLVAQMLGRPYPITGHVITGKGRGKKLGFPTANIEVPKTKLLPPPGVYIATDEEGELGLLYLGNAPTFGDEEFKVEFYRLEAKNYLKGDQVRLSVFRKMRGEIEFNTKEDLIAQMNKDKIQLIEWAHENNRE